jgi:hypothetical protein
MVANSHPPWPLLEVNCLVPLALHSPPHPLPIRKTFIYIQTTLKCLLLLSGTIRTLLEMLGSEAETHRRGTPGPQLNHQEWRQA